MPLLDRLLARARRHGLAWLLAAAAPALAAPPWLDAGRPQALAWQALEALEAAPEHGLDPADYGAAELRRQLEQARRHALAPAAAQALEQALSKALQRHLEHLHRGRVDPRTLHHDFAPARPDPFDAAAVLERARQHGRLDEALRAAAPALPLYRELQRALAHYRALWSHPAWDTPLPVPAGGRLDAGDAYLALARLAARLQALGDLDPAATPQPRYEGALVEAVRRFQDRHGLEADGIVGQRTRAQLDVPPRQRVRQIELTLERLRWTPLLQAPRMIVVNIPEFVLRAYEVRDGRIDVRLTMNVIVGKALDTRTPLFDEDMRSIEFSPFWNVPASIARKELLPRLRRDPGLAARDGFELVAADGRVVAWDPARLDEVADGGLRLRQRPGPRNALGDIKFVFPNRSSIYLHHTLATALFERGRRDFSHGCIRVQAPVELARFVLAPMPEWDEARIRAAMAAGVSSTLRLREPVPVLLAYGTALVKQGRLHFFDDLYGLDAVLDAALRKPRPGTP